MTKGRVRETERQSNRKTERQEQRNKGSEIVDKR